MRYVQLCHLILLITLSVAASAQSAYSGKIVVFGNHDTSAHKITYGQLIKEPSLVCDEKHDVVTEFRISFLPKGGEYLGPFTVQGNKLSDNIIERINKLRSEHPALVRVFIEDLMVKKSTSTVKAQSIILTCTE